MLRYVFAFYNVEKRYRFLQLSLWAYRSVLLLLLVNVFPYLCLLVNFSNCFVYRLEGDFTFFSANKLLITYNMYIQNKIFRYIYFKYFKQDQKSSVLSV
jgi:hypothetical protein